MSVRFRPFAGELDYMALRSLIVRNYADPKRRFYPSLGYVSWRTAPSLARFGQVSFEFCIVSQEVHMPIGKMKY